MTLCFETRFPFSQTSAESINYIMRKWRYDPAVSKAFSLNILHVYVLLWEMSYGNFDINLLEVQPLKNLVPLKNPSIFSRKQERPFGILKTLGMM